MSEAPPPTGADAMKATLTDRRFSDPDWIGLREDKAAREVVREA